MVDTQVKTVEERCQELGLKVYDTALPQFWVDKMAAVSYLRPEGNFVWCYDGSLMGGPVALTPDGIRMLEEYSLKS